MKIVSSRISLTLGDDPREIIAVDHLGADRLLASNARQFMMVRLQDEVSEPYFLDTVTGVSARDNEIILEYEDETGSITGSLVIGSHHDGIRFKLEVTCPKPVWMVEWKMTRIAVQNVLVPALGGQQLTEDMPSGTTLSYKYPFWWNAQFVVGETSFGGLWMRSMEGEPRFKMLRVHRSTNTFDWSIGFEADAPLKSTTLRAEWYLDGYSGAWQEPVDRHREWVRESFGLVPYRDHRHFPAWAGEVTCILEIWGMHRENPSPAHPYEVMIDRLKAWSKKHPPEQTLVYLPGFAEHGIDSRAPDYNPAPKLGGREGFGRLVDNAHAMGYRVMIHTNVLAMTYAHPRFSEFARHQVVDVFGRKQGWAMDIDGDWLTEPFFAYMNPGASEWGALMEEVLGNLISEFGLDAVFLDQTLLAFNVSNGPNFIDGMRHHVRRLQEAFPHVLFGGEGLHEQNVAVLPFAQIHGIDSIGQIQNMDDPRPWRKAHPISTNLFGPFTRFVAHLLTRHPSHSTFEFQETAYADLNIVPALVLYDQSHGLEGPRIEAMLRRARAMVNKEASSA